LTYGFVCASAEAELFSVLRRCGVQWHLQCRAAWGMMMAGVIHESRYCRAAWNQSFSLLNKLSWMRLSLPLPSTA
jgi:hypothetical protein